MTRTSTTSFQTTHAFVNPALLPPPHLLHELLLPVDRIIHNWLKQRRLIQHHHLQPTPYRSSPARTLHRHTLAASASPGHTKQAPTSYKAILKNTTTTSNLTILYISTFLFHKLLLQKTPRPATHDLMSPATTTQKVSLASKDLFIHLICS
jgi:hypothetical protein